jgi:hypothetical protein
VEETDKSEAESPKPKTKRKRKRTNQYLFSIQPPGSTDDAKEEVEKAKKSAVLQRQTDLA